MEFEQDHFSARAATYARNRPVYPDALYDELLSNTPGNGFVWDCGTGSGQAATALAERFEFVLATDLSPRQLAHRFEHPHTLYAVARAEVAPLGRGAADLVTVAAAVHWFDLDAFYAEVRRVLKPGGVLAVWTYLEMRVNAEFDAISDRFIRETLREDWPGAMRHPLTHYAELPFPFVPIALPGFRSTMRWTLEDVRAFIGTWSGTQRRAARTGKDPLDEVWPDLVRAWGPPESPRIVSWPLHVRAGRP